MSDNEIRLNNLDEVAQKLREKLGDEKYAKELRNKGKDKKYILLFAYNSTGKTRLSMAFKDLGKCDDESDARDTLYFNAFTEDLFYWDNDLNHDTRRVLCLNRESRFFAGIEALAMETLIGPLLAQYANFNFYIDYKEWEITFFRNRDESGEPMPIKVSRGEENIFVWCFFLAVAQLAIDGQEDHNWVKFIYIDDPISSLDDNNAIAVAHHLAQLFKKTRSDVKAIVSSHHTLFFNVMCNEWGNAVKYVLNKSEEGDGYSLNIMHGDTARFYHIAMLRELQKAAETGTLYTYHFNILRSVMEKTATFHGYENYEHFIKVEDDNDEKALLKRVIELFNHGGYSLMEPVEMLPVNKSYFRKVLKDFLDSYNFNQKILSDLTAVTTKP